MIKALSQGTYYLDITEKIDKMKSSFWLDENQSQITRLFNYTNKRLQG